MRRDGGLQRAAVVLLQATLAMGILIGCGVATRPPDGPSIYPISHTKRQPWGWTLLRA